MLQSVSTLRIGAAIVAWIALGHTRAVADSCRPQLDPEGRRLHISLFQYAGTTEGEPRNQFSQFRGILRDKIRVLVEEVKASGPELGYLATLSVYTGGKEALEDRLNSEAAVYDYWKQSHSLLLMRGVLVSKPPNYEAVSRLFLGDLRGELATPTFVAALPIVDDELARANDTHSLAILYSLAMDAARLDCGPALVVDLLSRVQDRLRDLKARGSPSPDLILMDAAVARAIDVQRARGRE